MYALSGAYAAFGAVDTEALNAYQSFVKFAQVDQSFSRVLKINSVENDSALALQLSNKSQHNLPSTLLIARRGDNTCTPYTRIVIMTAPSDDNYTCKVSVEWNHNNTSLPQTYAEKSFVTKSADLACMNLPKIDIPEGGCGFTEITYTLPQDIDGAVYSLCVSMFLSALEDISIALKKQTSPLIEVPVFMLIYDKGQVTPRKALSC